MPPKTPAPAILIDLRCFQHGFQSCLLPPGPLDPTQREMEESHSEGLFRFLDELLAEGGCGCVCVTPFKNFLQLWGSV